MPPQHETSGPHKRRWLLCFVVLAVIAVILIVIVLQHTARPRVIDLQVDQDFPAGMVYRSFRWRIPDRDTATQFHVVTVPLSRVRADLWFHPAGTESDQSLNITDVCSQANALFAINGGYFTDEFLPAGLAVDDAVEIAPLSGEPVQSGVVAIDASGMIELQHSSSVSVSHDAIQSGPFLIDPGGVIGIHSDDQRMQRRSVIALGRDGELVLMTADAISLFQLAQLLHSRPELFGVTSFDRALNLDGGPSSAFCIAEHRQDIVVQAAGPVHNFILFYVR
ncbi:phosphodiester glycosidase family protein [Phycisphaeraceae bacterium D3-23]